MSEPYILFEIAETTYAIPSGEVQQMEMIEKITRVPNTPDFVEGVVYLRGQVVPVINLRQRFGYEKKRYDIRSRLIVINIDRRVVGLSVDSARKFVSIDEAQILPTPEDIKIASGDYLSGMVMLDERLTLIINLRSLLNYQESNEIQVTINKE